MKQSLTYYLTLFVLKLKGVKKDFSQNPIDFKKIRKDDVHEPKGNFFKNHIKRCFDVSKTTVTEVKTQNSTQELIIFVPGGAFISGPVQHHWDSIKEIVKQTNHTVWMCDYPKAPEHKISEMSKNIDSVYQLALETYSGKNVTLIGGSVGATLITALTQRLVQRNLAKPKSLILVSPVMDASMSNIAIPAVDKRDPILSKAGVLSAKVMCAENNDLAHPMISPLHGDFKDFPKTILFLAENDITYPDQLLTVEKLKNHKVEIEVHFGENMPHIWPFLPVMKEAGIALNKIIKSINDNA